MKAVFKKIPRNTLDMMVADCTERVWLCSQRATALTTASKRILIAATRETDPMWPPTEGIGVQKFGAETIVRRYKARSGGQPVLDRSLQLGLQ